jgi:hypothetical protein
MPQQDLRRGITISGVVYVNVECHAGTRASCLLCSTTTHLFVPSRLAGTHQQITLPHQRRHTV